MGVSGLFHVLDSKKHLLHGMEAIKGVFQRCPTPKIAHFLLQNGLKKQILGYKQFFGGYGALCQAPQLGWSVRGRPTLCVACVAG